MTGTSISSSSYATRWATSIPTSSATRPAKSPGSSSTTCPNSRSLVCCRADPDAAQALAESWPGALRLATAAKGLRLHLVNDAQTECQCESSAHREPPSGCPQYGPGPGDLRGHSMPKRSKNRRMLSSRSARRAFSRARHDGSTRSAYSADSSSLRRRHEVLPSIISATSLIW